MFDFCVEPRVENFDAIEPFERALLFWLNGLKLLLLLLRVGFILEELVGLLEIHVDVLVDLEGLVFLGVVAFVFSF